MTDTTAPSLPPALPSVQMFYTRLAIGLAQGLALYLLYLAVDEKIWPANNGLVFAPLLIIALFVPVIAIQALNTMRRKTLVLWLVSATVILAALSFYSIWHAWPVDWSNNAGQKLMADGGTRNVGAWVPHIIPSFSFSLTVTVGLFIAHTLITGGDAERKFMASYTTHFDVAWKHGIQVVLTFAFVGVFWAFLWLGASLFELIKLKFLSQLLDHKWFSLPVIALATAAALHITDVNAGLIRGARTLALTLLSWLLPLLALLIFGFLFALPFTGVDLLWDTKNAAALTLSSGAIMLILINAVYQDGTPERAPPPLLRHVTNASMVAPVPLVVLAAYAIGLRVHQHGWTSDRVLAFACVLTAAFYAVGYFIAAIRRGAWLKAIEDWNFYAALFILALMLLLLTPVADPVRIGVSSQMSRFESGIVDATTLDFKSLRWDSGRYGKAALEKLAKAEGKDSDLIHKNAKAALDSQNDYYRQSNIPNAEALAQNITVIGKKQTLPQSFLKQDWSMRKWGSVPLCLESSSIECSARIEDLNKDGHDEIIVSDSAAAYIFSVDKDGQWNAVGMWNKDNYCETIADPLKDNDYKVVPPEPSLWPDLMVKGQRFRFSPMTNRQGC